MVLSHVHAVRKYCGQVYKEEEVIEKGWHGVRAHLRPEHIVFPSPDRLKTLSADGA